MPHRSRSDDDWDDAEDDVDEDGYDADEWGDDNDDAETVPCPHCGEMIYEDAPRCPHCGHDTSDVDAAPRMKPLWIVIGSLACMYAIARWVFG